MGMYAYFGYSRPVPGRVQLVLTVFDIHCVEEHARLLKNELIKQLAQTESEEDPELQKKVKEKLEIA